jgi:hypothetical protein
VEDGSKFGRPNGIANLLTQLANVTREENINLMSAWPNGDVPNLQIGVSRFTRHMVIHGLHQFCTTNCPKMIVGAVQFLQESGVALEGSEYVPMANDEMVKAVHGTFQANTRFVFISNALHQTLFNISNTPKVHDETKEESDEEDDVVIADLAEQGRGKRRNRPVNKMDA